MTLIIGQPAPLFTLADQSRQTHTLADYRGKKVLLYIYPKDDTPGCTEQACSIRDAWSELSEKIVVLGISKDSVASHKKFSEKFQLPFPLLSDPEAETIKAYGAWGEKSMYGKKYEGILRTSFLIDEKGNIAHVFSPVKTKTHAEDVLTVLNS